MPSRYYSKGKLYSIFEYSCILYKQCYLYTITTVCLYKYRSLYNLHLNLKGVHGSCCKVNSFELNFN